MLALVTVPVQISDSNGYENKMSFLLEGREKVNDLLMLLLGPDATEHFRSLCFPELHIRRADPATCDSF